jgi:Transcriptional regulators
MLSVVRKGQKWQIVGDWGLIEIPDSEARKIALQILAGSCDGYAAAEEGVPVGQKEETYAQRVVRLLSRDIAAGVFVPGQRLDEMLLARLYEVSRTPVREALMQLAIAGMVVRAPHRGCRVADSGGTSGQEM